MKHAEAIERLKGRFMTVSMCATSAEAKAENEAIDMALAALRAEEEREKGCRYCKGYMFNNPRTGEQFATACGVPLKHCPNCGRKLDGGGQDARKGEAE